MRGSRCRAFRCGGSEAEPCNLTSRNPQPHPQPGNRIQAVHCLAFGRMPAHVQRRMGGRPVAPQEGLAIGNEVDVAHIAFGVSQKMRNSHGRIAMQTRLA
jgi:hypothetical protein